MKLNPMKVYELGVKAVPSIRYAMGVAGVIAVGMISLIVARSTQNAMLSFAYVLAGMFLLLIFAGVAKAPGAGRGPAVFILWAVTLLFVTTLVLTMTAYAIGWPVVWARLVGAPMDVVPAAADPRSIVEVRTADGYFRKDGDRWIQYPPFAPGSYFTFREVRRDDDYIYLADSSRTKPGEANNGMLLRLPTHGGMIQWSYSNPVSWIDLTVAEPTRR